MALALLLIYNNATGQIWGSEPFADADGTKTGAGGIWTTDASACNLIDGGKFEVEAASGKIVGEDTDGVAVWKTQTIDISGNDQVQFSLDLDDDGNSTSADDEVSVYYTVDGGSEVLIFRGIGTLVTSPTTITSLNITGDDLVVIVKMNTNDLGEKYTLDNVIIEDFTPVTYYSYNGGGNWNDVNSWSLTDHNTLDVPASVPNADDIFVVIGDNDVITYNVSDQEMANLVVTDNATLQFSGNNRIVDIVNNGTVDIQATGTLDDNGTSGSRLRYQSTGYYTINNDGNFEIGRINTNLEESVLTLTGSSDITLTEHLNYNDPGTEIVYSGDDGATFTVPLIRFKNTTNKFTNNGTTVVTSEIQRQSGTTDGSVVTNNAGASLTVQGNINCNNNTWDIINYGTFDFNGQWTNITAGEVNFYNYAGATFNYGGGTGDDNDIYIYANYDNNTINYDRAGDQDIILPQDNYYDLIVSGSGTKTPTNGNDIDVNDTLEIAGTAILDVSANSNDIVLAGNWFNNGGTFTEGAQTVTLDGTGAQELTSETFNNLTINKSAGTVTIEAASDVVVNNTFTMTQGTFNTGTRSLSGTANFVATGGDVQFQKTGVTIPETTGSVTCTGGMLTINGAGAQTIRDTPGAEEYHGLLLDGSGTKTLLGDIDVDSILTIDAGVILDVSGSNYSMSVEGNWNNSGTFNEQAGTVTFDGSSAITISASAEETFHNLTVNNSTPASAITLNEDVRVSNQVTFTAGHIVSSAANTFKMSSGATVAAVVDGSHVIGPMEKDMAVASLFEFPIGDGVAYRRAGLTPAGATATTYQIEYVQDKYPVADPTVIDHISEFEYWMIERTAGTEDAAVRLSWDANSLVDNSATLAVVNFNGTTDWPDVCSGCSTGADFIEMGADFTFATTKYFTLGCNTPGDNPLVGTRFSIGGGGNWSDGNKWSYTDGGAACSCTPTASSDVTIKTGETLNIDVAASANTIVVEGGATLQWTSGNDLTINRNGAITVDVGGTLDLNGNTGEIDLATAGGAYTITNDGTFNAYALKFSNTGGSVVIAGGAEITIDDNLEIVGANINVTNNNSNTINLDNSSTHGDFLFKAASQTFTNNGTVTVGNDFQFESSDGTFTNNGSLTISNDLNATGASSNSIINNAASSDITVTGGIDLNNEQLRINNYGDFDLDGDYSNVDAGEGLIYNYAGSTFEFAATTASDGDVYLYANYATNLFEYNASADQNILTPQDNYYNITLSESGTKATTGNLNIDGSLIISGTANLDVATGTDDINLAGDWTNSGTFDEGAQTVTFDGTADQTITNTSGETFRNLTVNKASGDVILNTSSSTSITIETLGFLTLTSGIIETTSSELITIQNNAGMLGGNATSFIDGPLRKEGTNDFTYQVGDQGKWAPVGIDNNTNGETFTVEYVKSIPADTSVTGGLNNVSVVEYWNIDEATPGGESVDIKLYFKDKSFSGITDAGDLTVAHFDGADWEDISQAAIDFSDPGWIQTTGVSDFSPFTFGSGGGVNPLPIELLHFNAQQSNTGVELTWSTASEINNDFFTVEKSIDGVNFETVAIVKGAGNSTHQLNYTSLDANPYLGTSYYRLKQTDFDGTFYYSNVEVVQISTQTQTSINVYPNPNNGREINISLSDPNMDHLNILLIDVLGNELYSTQIATNNNDVINHSLNALPQLSPGTYIIVATADNFFSQKRIIVN